MENTMNEGIVDGMGWRWRWVKKYIVLNCIVLLYVIRSLQSTVRVLLLQRSLYRGVRRSGEEHVPKPVPRPSLLVLVCPLHTPSIQYIQMHGEFQLLARRRHVVYHLFLFVYDYVGGWQMPRNQ